MTSKVFMGLAMALPTLISILPVVHSYLFPSSTLPWKYRQDTLKYKVEQSSCPSLCVKVMH